MPQFDTVIRSQRVVTQEGVVPAAVGIRSGRVTAVCSYDAPLCSDRETDLGTVALLPGGIDLDVTVQPPGRPLREGYAATDTAALRGGVTTMVITPAPADPAITRLVALDTHATAAAKTTAHVVFLGGITARSTPADLADLRAAGAAGFHCSLSGEGPGAFVDDTRLHKAMAEAAAMEVPLFVHAEDARELVTPARAGNSAFLASRPPRAERRGLERVVAAARATGARTHVSPFTAAECAAVLAAARAIGVPITAHTCPHYLCLPAEHVPDDSPAHRCRPPLRSGANRDALWRALLSTEDSAITTIGSGHRPGTGVAALPWTLPALWTAAARRGRGLADLVRWTAAAPAELIRLHAKGRIASGYDADLVAFDTAAQQTVPADDPGPYAGRSLNGRITRTWVGGRDAFPPEEGSYALSERREIPIHAGDGRPGAQQWG
ncbi:MAG: amidohydrolase family protein [Nocardiopsaceae bacterium]|nr:amidohydrolase family protein [Nocardiopsaceae bacterium]